MSDSYAIVAMDAREILDSRGIPTVHCGVRLGGGAEGWASVPSGASTGSHEAHELRDGDGKRYGGKGVQKAIESVRQIFAALQGMDAREQGVIDATMVQLDGTKQKKKLGANAILAVSLAVAKAAAAACRQPLYRYWGGAAARVLPIPMMNVINGGCHADNGLAIQELMIVPHGAPSFAEALRMGSEVFHYLKALLAEGNFVTAVGDEGGFAPNLDTHREALNLMMQAIERAGYQSGAHISLAMDAAASEFYQDNRYHIENQALSGTQLREWYEALIKDYPIVSIEDPFAEDDDAAWQDMMQHCSSIQIVGDDLFVTHPTLIERGYEKKMANAVLLKPNQVGTLSETQQAYDCAAGYGWGGIMSHRSGETEDTTIADLVVAFGCGQIKTGSLSRSERLAKYNRLLAIEEQLGAQARYGIPLSFIR